MNHLRLWTIAIPLLFTGCLEYHTRTTVRTDGSLLRAVTMRGDSSHIHAWQYVVPVDSTWRWERAKTGDREWHLNAQREFASADAFNGYQDSLLGRILRSTVSVDRSFRWFTTRIVFREHFDPIYPFRSVPLTDYLSPREIEAFLQHEVHKKEFATPGDSLSLEDAEVRFDDWARRNEFEENFRALRTGVERLAERGFSPESLDRRKEWLSTKFETVRDTGDSFDPEDMERRREYWFKSLKDPVLRQAAEANRSGFDDIVRQAEQAFHLMEYPHKSTVVMPGALVETNARTVDGPEATWENYLVVLYFQDFEMVAEAEVTNWWAVVFTGVALAGGLLIILRWKSRRA